MPNNTSGIRPHEITTRDAAEVCAYGQQPLDALCIAGRIPGAIYRNGQWHLPRTVLAHFGEGGMVWAPLGRADVRP